VATRAQWAFQVSQGSVETLFRWGGKRLHIFAANLFRRRCTKFRHHRPSFIGDITKIFWSLFLYTVYFLISRFNSSQLRTEFPAHCEAVELCRILYLSPMLMGVARVFRAWMCGGRPRYRRTDQKRPGLYRMVQSILWYLEPLSKARLTSVTDIRTDFAITNAALHYKGTGRWAFGALYGSYVHAADRCISAKLVESLR